jgi:hypothetical protein
MWILVAVPLFTIYLQVQSDVRTYRADPACTLGFAAPPIPGGGCGVGTVTVAAVRPVGGGGYTLSVRFADGARREFPLSAAGYPYLHVPGTLAFVQVRDRRVALVGDERYVETTADHPERRLPRARDAALAAVVCALAATVAALALVRRDARRRATNDAP